MTTPPRLGVERERLLSIGALRLLDSPGDAGEPIVAIRY